MSAPESLHVKSQDMPVIECDGYRVRIVLGESNGVSGHQSPVLPMTILDGNIDSNRSFSHQLSGGENTWITAIDGELMIRVSGREVHLIAGQAIAISDVSSDTITNIQLLNSGSEKAHFALFSGTPTNETYVQKGPLIMGSAAEIAQAESDYASGKFGQLV